MRLAGASNRKQSSERENRWDLHLERRRRTHRGRSVQLRWSKRVIAPTQVRHREHGRYDGRLDATTPGEVPVLEATARSTSSIWLDRRRGSGGLPRVGGPQQRGGSADGHVPVPCTDAPERSAEAAPNNRRTASGKRLAT